MDIRKINLLGIVIIIVIFVLAFFTLFKESRAKAAVLKETKLMLLENLKSAGNMAMELDKIREEIDTIQKNLDSFDKQLPGEKRIHNFLVEIDRLAKKNSLNLKSIIPGKTDKGALYSRVPINITGNATFNDFYRFLFQLENIPRITRIEHLQVSRLPKDNTCDIEIDLAVFASSN